MILHKNVIENLDMSRVELWSHPSDLPHITSKPGTHHYRLLSYISMQYNDINIADVGCRRGASAYASAYNSRNQVFTFDIDPRRDISKAPNKPSNVHFSMHNCIEDISPILNCYIIFLDVDPHDGVQEKKFLDALVQNKWCGILLLDDISYNDTMRAFWQGVKLDKLDITKYGQCSGCGLINFSKEIIVLG